MHVVCDGQDSVCLGTDRCLVSREGCSVWEKGHQLYAPFWGGQQLLKLHFREGYHIFNPTLCQEPRMLHQRSEFWELGSFLFVSINNK